jgi:host factor-I protein
VQIHYIKERLIVIKCELNRSARELAEMQKTQDLQDTFLNQVRKDRAVITVFLMNGFQFRGVVRGYDAFTVVLDTDGKQQLIYKHAISTLVPPKPTELWSGQDT